MTKHHDIDESDPTYMSTRRVAAPHEMPSDPNSPYGAEEDRQRRAAEAKAREAHENLVAANELAALGVRLEGPSGNAFDRVREIGIEVLMRNEGWDRATALRHLADAQKPAAVESPEARATRARERERDRLRAWLAASKIPVRPEIVEDVIAGTCLRTPATRAVTQWFTDPTRRVIALLGPMGIGKTVAAALVGVAFARRGKVVRYMREPMLVRWASSSTLTHEQRMEEMLDADLVIVDELGMSLSSQGEKARDAIFTLLDHRIAGERRTILIGNLMAPDKDGTQRGSSRVLADKYGARLVDRLNEVGRIAELAGESMRGAQ
jgi:DNA replication protein DnaC